MASASFKKYVVNLIKSNESDFRYRFYRGLLFDSNGRRHNLYSEIKTNPLLRGKLTNILCAKSLDQLNNVRFVFNNQMTDDEAATYACNLLSVCAKKVNRYLDLRSQYERVLMSSDYETAAAILNEIENELGISLWLCGQKLLLKEQTLGLEGNKSELSNGNYSSFAIFYNKIIAVFWDYTQSLLSTIRKKIETELTEYYLNALSELEGNLKKVSNAPDTIQEMLANCNLAKARVVQTMTQFAAAFTVNRSSYNDFTMDELTASCKMVASKSHSNSDAINWDIKADNSLLFSGKYFASFVDILNILLSNAIEHSGYDHASDLSLQVSIHEVQDSKDKEKTMIPNVFLFNKVMCMEVSNSLATDVDELLLEEKMRGIFTDLVENNSRKAKIQSEGGSGLYTVTLLQFKSESR